MQEIDGILVNLAFYQICTYLSVKTSLAVNNLASMAYAMYIYIFFLLTSKEIAFNIVNQY